jgi:hypothetical protein
MFRMDMSLVDIQDDVKEKVLRPELVDLATQIALHRKTHSGDVVDDFPTLHCDGAPLVPASTSPNLTLPLLVAPLGCLAHCAVLKLCAQQRHGERLVLMLTPLPFRAHDEARRKMLHLHRRVGHVAVLSARTRATAPGDHQVAKINPNLGFRGLHQDRNRDRRGVHTASSLGWRHTLPAMTSRLVGERTARIAPRDADGQVAFPLLEHIESNVKETPGPPSSGTGPAAPSKAASRRPHLLQPESPQ